MQRADFLARVKTAADAGRMFRVPVRADIPENAGYVGGSSDLCQRFADELNAVGGFAEVVVDRGAAQETLRKLLDQYLPNRALCWEHPVLTQLGVSEILGEQHIERLCFANLSPLSPEMQRERMLAAEIGITSVTYAIAETGSLVMAAGTGTERSASLLPPIHVAIVEEGQILPDLFDLYAKQIAAGAETIARNVTLITGPSKTGDIELQLTTGVHGPGKLHVIVIRE